MNSEHSPDVRQGGLWAWLVSFTVSIGLHVGVVLFVALSVALFIYAVTLALGGVSTGVHLVTWFFAVVSLAVWALLVQMLVQSFRPHAIRGLGSIVVATTGCDWGEIAADVGAGLLGLAQLVPLLWVAVAQRAPLQVPVVLTALSGGLFTVIGWGSLGLRLWLRRRRLRMPQRGVDSAT